MNVVRELSPHAPALPRERVSLGAITRDALRRPLFFVAMLYSIAIAYERIVDVEMFKPYRVLGLILVAGALITRGLRLDHISRTMIGFLFMGLIGGVMELFGPDSRDDLFIASALLWTFNLATYVAMFSIVSSRRDVLVLAVVHALALLTSAYGIGLDARAIEAGMVRREFGDFKNPANAAVSMLFSCLVLLALLRASGLRKWLTPPVANTLSMLVFLFFAYTASLTGSRSGAVLLLVGVVCYILLSSVQRTLVTLALAGGLVVAGMVVGVLNLDERVSDLAESNILAARVEKKGFDTDRLYLWRSGLDAFIDSYGLGLGISRYPEVHREYFAEYAHLSDPRWLDTDLTLHNDYVTALVEHGLIGFMFFLVLCQRLLATARAIRSHYVRAIALSMLVGIAVNGLTHTGLPYFCVWFYFALLSAWRLQEIRAEPGATTGKTITRVRR